MNRQTRVSSCHATMCTLAHPIRRCLAIDRLDSCSRLIQLKRLNCRRHSECVASDVQRFSGEVSRAAKWSSNPSDTMDRVGACHCDRYPTISNLRRMPCNQQARLSVPRTNVSSLTCERGAYRLQATRKNLVFSIS